MSGIEIFGLFRMEFMMDWTVEQAWQRLWAETCGSFNVVLTTTCLVTYTAQKAHTQHPHTYTTRSTAWHSSIDELLSIEWLYKHRACLWNTFHNQTDQVTSLKVLRAEEEDICFIKKNPFDCFRWHLQPYPRSTTYFEYYFLQFERCVRYPACKTKVGSVRTLTAASRSLPLTFNRSESRDQCQSCSVAANR